MLKSRGFVKKLEFWKTIEKINTIDSKELWTNDDIVNYSKLLDSLYFVRLPIELFEITRNGPRHWSELEKAIKIEENILIRVSAYKVLYNQLYYSNGLDFYHFLSRYLIEEFENDSTFFENFGELHFEMYDRVINKKWVYRLTDEGDIQKHIISQIEELKELRNVEFDSSDRIVFGKDTIDLWRTEFSYMTDQIDDILWVCTVYENSSFIINQTDINEDSINFIYNNIVKIISELFSYRPKTFEIGPYAFRGNKSQALYFFNHNNFLLSDILDYIVDFDIEIGYDILQFLIAEIGNELLAIRLESGPDFNKRYSLLISEFPYLWTNIDMSIYNSVDTTTTSGYSILFVQLLDYINEFQALGLLDFYSHLVKRDDYLFEDYLYEYCNPNFISLRDYKSPRGTLKINIFDNPYNDIGALRLFVKEGKKTFRSHEVFLGDNFYNPYDIFYIDSLMSDYTFKGLSINDTLYNYLNDYFSYQSKHGLAALNKWKRKVVIPGGFYSVFNWDYIFSKMGYKNFIISAFNKRYDKRRKVNCDSVLFFGDFDYGGNSLNYSYNYRYSKGDFFYNLPGSRLELDAISGHIEKVNFFNNVVDKNIMIKRIASSSIAHISTHSGMSVDLDTLLDRDIFNTHFLALDNINNDSSNSRKLTIMDLFTAGIDTVRNNLVVLSSCNSNVGEISDVGLSYSIANALIMLGFKNILVSYWPIRDNDSYVYMNIFYGYLKRFRGNIYRALNKTRSELKELGYSDYVVYSYSLIQ